MPMDPRVATWSPACQAIALLLGPYVEVVLHDAVADTVLAIWNPMTNREPGDPSLLGELDDLEPSANDVYDPYEKLLPEGRRLSSVSAILRDQGLVLCVNFDRGPSTQAAALLGRLAAPVTPRPESLFAQDWVERINHIVGAFVLANGKPVGRLSRAQRLELLAELDDAGIFAVCRAVAVVASALDASRSTVYSLLAELKDGRTP
jgi:predicted transcriptional regulator YheO